MRLLVLVTLAAVLASCADPSPSAPAVDPAPPASAAEPALATSGPVTTAGPVRYETSTMVIDAGPDPELCLGVVLESLPPQCDGPAVLGWSWDEVDGEEAADGVRWGEYRVVGTWDGEALTLTEPPGPPEPPPPGPADARRLDTPCPPPPGGWAVVDPATATQLGLDAAMTYARSQPDFSASWYDRSTSAAAAGNSPERHILNVRFTGDVARHEAELRSRFGGRLCVSAGGRPYDELEAIQREVHDELGALWTSIDEIRSVVVTAVPVVEPGMPAALDERHGPGVVEVQGALQPVG